MKDFTVQVNVLPTSKDGKLQLKFIGASMDANDLDGNFKGKTEIIESV